MISYMTASILLLIFAMTVFQISLALIRLGDYLTPSIFFISITFSLTLHFGLNVLKIGIYFIYVWLAGYAIAYLSLFVVGIFFFKRLNKFYEK